jgi:DNA polymerase III subunit delta'
MVGPDGSLALPWLAGWLEPALRTQHAHALLLHGPHGVGQWELAVTLAQAWLCESAGGPRPCGRCASCRLVQAHAHPDLLVLLPEALQEELGWAAGDSDGDAGAGADKAGKGRQPSKEIKVDAVRAAVSFAQTTSARGRGKVLVIHPAERMNGIAANALLKTLEEPPGDARFVLGCAAPEALLPTIRSRCQAVALTIPQSGAAIDWLTARGVPSPEVMLAAAGGQPIEALRCFGQGIDAAAWRHLPNRVARCDTSALAGWPLPRAIDALQKVCHDALCLAVGAPPRYFPQDALPAGAARIDAVLAWSRELARASRHAEHPWSAALFVDALVGQGHKALQPAHNARPGAKSLSVNSRA